MKFTGIVEGFYGKPWSRDSRIDMMKFLGNHGYNLYVYAPKGDPFHRAKWREPYPQNMLNDFKELVNVGNNANVEFSIALSPGLSLVYSKPKEVDLFVEKMLSFYDIGIRIFGLFFDDIPQMLQNDRDIRKFPDLVHAQIHFAHEVYKKLELKVPDLKLMLCPTIYHGDGRSDYVQALGKELDQKIYILWTGPQICSENITTKDAISIENILKRKPIYWDNYPVNDLHMASELHIGPYMNREPGVLDHASGFILNPMIQMEPSKIPLVTASYFFKDPYNYNHKKAFEKAVSEFVSKKIRNAFYHFSSYNVVSPLHPAESLHAKLLINRFEKFYSEEKFADLLSSIKKESEEIKIYSDILIMMMPDIKFFQEIIPWIKEYEEWGETLSDLEEAIQILQEFFEKENLQKELLLKVAESIEKVRKDVRKFADHKTAIFTREMRNFVYETLIKMSVMSGVN
ncbi:protein O-GlcNAcase [Athalassotoga sp.]|uniref:protein O-GlcNAcase n=1 Tax=Athalassotoga sp. TaxID=2022597 RepID=UPI003D00C6E1